MSYYQLNRDKLLEKTKNRYHNGSGKKVAKYYEDNQEVLKEKTRNQYINFSEGEKEVKKTYGLDKYRNGTENKKITFFRIV